MSGDAPRLVISPDLVERMLDLAWSVYPAEAVGLLGGIANEVKSVWPLRNLAANLTFLADPYEQYVAMTEIMATGEVLLASFHSHPDAPPLLSEVDGQFVFEVAPIAVVIGLESVSHTARLAAFSQKGGSIEEVAIIQKLRN